jgi:protocatechuate 3,4-dioxygenase beta subunit
MHHFRNIGALLSALLLFLLMASPAMGQASLREPTPAQTEGPYFKAGSPERQSLRAVDTIGTPLRLSGRVVDREGKALAGAVLEFWQADGEGRYDNGGFALRGRQFTDADGRYALDTVLPGLYPGRTRHIHVKIATKGRQPLTTQLYFAGEKGNDSDRLVEARLLVTLVDGAGGKTGVFDFVLEAGR